jgi:hypothetical protein
MASCARSTDIDLIGVSVTCTVCHKRKKPLGRSAPRGAFLCDHECPGYYQEPKPGELWSGETRDEFGY